MAKSKTAKKVRKLPVRRARAALKVRLKQVAATYVCRFSGFFRYPPVGQSLPHHLAGVGRFDVDANGSLIGEQSASFIPMFNSGLKFKHSRYQLKGKYTPNDNGTGSVSIDFYKLDANDQPSTTPDMFGDFAVCYLGPKARPTTIWLISSATTKQGVAVDEMVSGEAALVVD